MILENHTIELLSGLTGYEYQKRGLWTGPLFCCLKRDIVIRFNIYIKFSIKISVRISSFTWKQVSYTRCQIGKLVSKVLINKEVRLVLSLFRLISWKRYKC